MLTVAEVASRLRISKAVVYRLLAEKKLEHYAIGGGQGGKRISEEQLAAYLERVRCGEPRSAPKATPRKPLKLEIFTLRPD